MPGDDAFFSLVLCIVLREEYGRGAAAELVDDVGVRGALDFNSEVVGTADLGAADGDRIPGKASFTAPGNRGLGGELEIGFFVFFALGIKEAEEILEVVHEVRR